MEEINPTESYNIRGSLSKSICKMGHPIQEQITHDKIIELGYVYANENGEKFYWHLDAPYMHLRHDTDGEWLFWYCEDEETLISQVGIESIADLRILHLILFGTKI